MRPDKSQRDRCEWAISARAIIEGLCETRARHNPIELSLKVAASGRQQVDGIDDLDVSEQSSNYGSQHSRVGLSLTSVFNCEEF